MLRSQMGENFFTFVTHASLRNFEGFMGKGIKLKATKDRR